MGLLQISDPSPLPASNCRKKLAVGIDLGTTNSLIAFVDAHNSVQCVSNNNQDVIPSVVYYGGNTPVVGIQAMQYIDHDAQNTIVSSKRMLGYSFDELVKSNFASVYNFVKMEHQENNIAALETSYGVITPVQISGHILTALVDYFKAYCDQTPEGAVITVPAYFDDSQRQAVRDAALLAGLPLLRLLNEPTAAAIAYGLDQCKEGLFAVYDLGGGTFDISLLSIEQGVFHVLATGGDACLGGNDFDDLIADWLIKQMQLMDYQSINAISRATLLQQARRARETLSHSKKVLINLGELEILFNEATLKELIDPLIVKTVKIFSKVLKSAQTSIEELDEIIMVGGTTRMPMIRQAVESFFNKKPLVDIDPDRVVAIGAALQADHLIGNQPQSNLLLLDVLPLSLGIETLGSLMEVIIPKNTTIPACKSQIYTTAVDYQTKISIKVLQGERPLVKDNRELAVFELNDILPLPAGKVKIEVTFRVDADGIMDISAKDLETGKITGITVKPSYGLTAEMIEHMLVEAQLNSESDRYESELAKKYIEAQQLYTDLLFLFQQQGQLALDGPAYQAMNELLKELQVVLEQKSDLKTLHRLLLKLKRISDPLIKYSMNSHIKQKLQGLVIN